MQEAKKYCKDCKHYQVKEHECFWHGAKRPFKLACSDYGGVDSE